MRANVLELMIEREPLLCCASIEKPSRNYDLRTREPEHRRASVGSYANRNALYQSGRPPPVESEHANVYEAENNDDQATRQKPRERKHSLNRVRDTASDPADDPSRDELDRGALRFQGREKSAEHPICADSRHLRCPIRPLEPGEGSAGRPTCTEQSEAGNRDHQTERRSPDRPHGTAGKRQ